MNTSLINPICIGFEELVDVVLHFLLYIQQLIPVYNYHTYMVAIPSKFKYKFIINDNKSNNNLYKTNIYVEELY